MQKFVMIASLLGLAACGLSQEKFEEDFATKYCEEATACNAEFDCSILDAAADDTEMTCTFDADKAQACLDGTYECDADLGFVTPPAECADALVCEMAGDDDDAAGDDDDAAGDDDDAAE